MAAPEKPLTRKESYLAGIAGQNTVLPEKPFTREETYLAAIAGQDVVVPDKSITREEAYLDAILKGGGGGGGSTLIAKTITENGTYDPKDDGADGYSSVEVNVSGGGDTFTVRIITKSTGNYDAAITVKQIVNGVEIISTDHLYSDLSTPITIFDFMQIVYEGLSYRYTLLRESLTHAAGYTEEWGYDQEVSFEESCPLEV